jgi:hypothetical protein
MKHTLSPFDALPPSKPVDGQQQTGSGRSEQHDKSLLSSGCITAMASIHNSEALGKPEEFNQQDLELV